MNRVETTLPAISETFNGSNAPIIIVGAGLAGLATAIKLREQDPDQPVVIIDRPHPQSNTQIAGQRLRAGKSGLRQDPSQEITGLLAAANEGGTTEQMSRFANLAEEELNYWHRKPEFTESIDSQAWFGPQWGTANAAGGGRGRSVLSWFKRATQDAGVNFVHGTVSDMHCNEQYVRHLDIQDRKGDRFRLSAGTYILANGTLGGSLYHSTNKNIDRSAHHLAFDAGLDLVDNTLHMIHPFGNCDADGKPQIGCFETDTLEGARVFLDGLSGSPKYDAETSDLLAAHQAHYQFPQIAERFRQYGSVVRLELPDGSQRLARTGHHYAHTGIATEDGVAVTGVDNLYAVGDASGIGHWTNSRVRLPGFALVKCLTDAVIATKHIRETTTATAVDIRKLGGSTTPHAHNATPSDAAILDINTGHAIRWASTTAESADGRDEIAESWQDELGQLREYTPLARISQAIALAHRRAANGGADIANKFYDDVGEVAV